MANLIGIKEYRKILLLKDVLPPQPGYVNTTEGEVITDSNLRSTEVRWIRRDEYPDVFNLMQEYGRRAQIFLGIDRVLTIKEPIQLSTYYPGDFYGWHKDGRHMSCSVLLTDKFTGGRLEFKDSSYPLLREAGKAVFFPNIEHRVKPVLTGVRDSLVVWWR